VRHIFASGYRKGSALMFFTLTAPGDQAHHRGDGQQCACTPAGGVSVAGFNADAGTRFNRFITKLRRHYGDVQYVKAAEVQKRGALHFHMEIRVSNTIAAKLLADFDARHPDCTLRLLAISAGFGHEIDLQLMGTEERDIVRRAGYCAKYAAKSCDDRQTLPWLDRSTGEVLDGNSRYRTWSASRSWGTTMRDVIAEQKQWWASQTDSGDGAAPEGAQAAAALLDPEAHCYANTEPGGVA
jgi:hypothetical protein